MSAKKTNKKSTTKSTKSTKSKKSSKSVKSSVKPADLKQYNPNPVIPSGKVESTELDKVLSQVPQDQKEKLTHIKSVIESFRDKIVPRLEGYVMGISLLPPSTEKDAAEGEDPKLVAERINVLVLIDDNDVKKLSAEELQEKIQKIAFDLAKPIDKNLYPQILLLSNLWQQCYDAKYEPLQMIAMSAIVYDTGMLQAIKIAEVHKSMVLKKFEKYIVSYVLSGSVTQGKANKDSDVDVFVVIDDTDVKKMTRVELQDKLRAIIVGMGMEAGQMTGIQNKINIQVYILTSFWENVKDANPTIFTLLRHGVPFYDRGVFMPWKQLLEMGRIKPSPEAIDMFMQSGSQFMERIYMKIRDIVMEDLFWALLTPSQAALMMYGVPPPTPKEAGSVMTDILVKKEGLLEPEYVKILEKVLKTRKDLEHGIRRKVTGKEMDEMVTKADVYLKRIDKLFKEIEDKKQGEQVLHMYESIITILRDALRLDGVEKVDDKNIEKLFKEHLIVKGVLPQHFERIFKQIIKGKKDFDAGKLTKQEVISIVKDSKELSKVLVDHIQRKRGREIERARVKVKYGETFGEVVLLGDKAYIVQDLDSEEKRITKANINKKGGLKEVKDISYDEFEDALVNAQIPPRVFLKNALFEDLKKIFGDDVEILVNY